MVRIGLGGERRDRHEGGQQGNEFQRKGHDGSAEADAEAERKGRGEIDDGSVGPRASLRIDVSQPRAAAYSSTARSRSALPITLTEDSAMAAAAICGESSRCKVG